MLILDIGVKLYGIETLLGEVQRLGLPVENISIELGQSVTVHCNTAKNFDREKVILALGNVEGVSVVKDNILVENP